MTKVNQIQKPIVNPINCAEHEHNRKVLSQVFEMIKCVSEKEFSFDHCEKFASVVNFDTFDISKEIIPSKINCCNSYLYWNGAVYWEKGTFSGDPLSYEVIDNTDHWTIKLSTPVGTADEPCDIFFKANYNIKFGDLMCCNPTPISSC